MSNEPDLRPMVTWLNEWAKPSPPPTEEQVAQREAAQKAQEEREAELYGWIDEAVGDPAGWVRTFPLHDFGHLQHRNRAVIQFWLEGFTGPQIIGYFDGALPGSAITGLTQKYPKSRPVNPSYWSGDRDERLVGNKMARARPRKSAAATIAEVHGPLDPDDYPTGLKRYDVSYYASKTEAAESPEELSAAHLLWMRKVSSQLGKIIHLLEREQE